MTLGHLASRKAAQKPLWGEVGTSAQRVKIDFDTPWETGVTQKLQLAAIVALVIVFAGLVGGPKGGKPHPEMLYLLPIPLAFAGWYWWRRRSVSEYYIADLASRQLLFCREEHDVRQEKPCCSFEMVFCVGVSAVRHSTKGGHHYEYHVALVDRHARITVMSDPSRTIPEVEQKALMLAELLGCRFEPTQGMTELVAKLNPGSDPTISRRHLAG
ncbi:MAG TPA: hypothetical protein PKO06_16535 [Candidatus Ozemobacteraceae bacterium]|nr:hypothetical protein [Candidatus Ozemobacteraceae bacterium]